MLPLPAKLRENDPDVTPPGLFKPALGFVEKYDPTQ
jgi:hypothetical protein